jgi:hypothetical protein
MGKKQRMCPAIGHGISAAECGENRISRYQCPADCPHNPWALGAYDQEQEIETAFFERLRRYAAGDQVTRGVRNAAESTMIADQYRNLRAWFIQRDEQGQTMMDRWARAGFQGLNNDQCVLARCHAQVRVVVMETLDHVSRDAVRVEDRLDLATPPVVVQDRSLARQSGRFSRLVSWIFPLPHYSRITTAAISVPDIGSLEAEEIVGAVAQHLGGPPAGEPLREWLISNYVALYEGFELVEEAIRRKMFENVVYTKVYYRLDEPVETFVKAMAGAPEAVLNTPNEEDRKEGFTHEWAWLDTDAESLRNAVGGGRPTLGRVLLGAGKIRLEGGGEKRAQRMQEAFERHVGRRVSFVSRRVDDLGRQMIARDAKPFDPSLVPPRLLALAPQIETSVQLVDLKSGVSAADIMRDTRRQWVDQPVPALEGKTPRQAAGEPALRPKVVALVKESIRRADRAGLGKDQFEDEGWMAVELGLTELQLPVPPRLAELAVKGIGGGKFPSADDDDADSDDKPVDDLSAFLGDDEAMDRNIEAFEAKCPDLDEWVDRVTATLDDHEYDSIHELVAMAWGLASARRERDITLNLDRLNHQLRALIRASQSQPEGSDAWYKTTMPAPKEKKALQLCALLLSETELSRKPPPKPITFEAFLLGVHILRAVTQELDRE